MNVRANLRSCSTKSMRNSLRGTLGIVLTIVLALRNTAIYIALANELFVSVFLVMKMVLFRVTIFN